MTDYRSEAPTRARAGKKSSTMPAPAAQQIPSAKPVLIEEPPVANEGLRARYCALGEVLYDACRTDEPDIRTGSSTRLIRIAYELTEMEQVSIDERSDDRGYDIAALLSASRRVPGDQQQSNERQELIERAGKILEGIADCADILHEEQAPASGRAKTGAATPKPLAAAAAAAAATAAAPAWHAGALTTLVRIDELLADAIDLASTKPEMDDALQVLMQAQENVSRWGDLSGAEERDYLDALVRVEALVRCACVCCGAKQTEGWHAIARQVIATTQKALGGASPAPTVPIVAPQVTAALLDITERADAAKATRPRLTEGDIESAGMEAVMLGMLVRWCIEADTLLREIRVIASYDGSDLGEELAKRDIRYNSPSWTDSKMDQGLHYVIERQITLVEQVTGVAA